LEAQYQNENKTILNLIWQDEFELKFTQEKPNELECFMSLKYLQKIKLYGKVFNQKA
jgi:hypothetical protein